MGEVSDIGELLRRHGDVVHARRSGWVRTGVVALIGLGGGAAGGLQAKKAEAEKLELVESSVTIAQRIENKMDLLHFEFTSKLNLLSERVTSLEVENRTVKELKKR